MSYQERDFQTDFNKWCKHFIDFSAVFELKASKSNSLPFNSLKEHQANALYACKNNKIVWKIPDAGFQNPFDSFVLKEVHAYVVVMFNTKSDDFYMIPIENWTKEAESSERKSITKEKAQEIGVPCSLHRGIKNKDSLNFETEKAKRWTAKPSTQNVHPSSLVQN